MRALFHLINILLWMMVPVAITFILSFPFDFEYKSAVQSGGFVFLYVFYCIGAVMAYGVSTTEGVDSMHFLPIKED